MTCASRRNERHLELLTLPELATRLRQSTTTVRKRRDLPPSVRLVGRAMWFRRDVEHLLLPPRAYKDEIAGDELASLLGTSVATCYLLCKRGVLPRPTIGKGRRSRWSRKDVEQHLRAQVRVHHAAA